MWARSIVHRCIPNDEGQALSDNFRELVKQCIVGDQSSMLELVDRYKGQVFGLCYRMLGQREDAEDAAQESFIRVLKNIHRWDPDRDFEPWLLAIAGNRCRTALAKRCRRPAPQPLVDQLPDHAPDLQCARNLSEEVHLALQKLRAEYRQAFVLFSDHEMGYAEIAETMDCPVGTVKTWVHRARRELIHLLRERGVLEENSNEMRRVSSPVRSIA